MKGTKYMLHKKIDEKTRITLGEDCLRILRCKRGDTVDISMLVNDEDICDMLIITKVKEEKQK
jgi:hypothetical protein